MRRAGFSILLVLSTFTLIFTLPAGLSLSAQGDIVFSRKPELGKEPPPSVFPHWVHRIRFKCHVCHDAIFKMKKGANPITMEALTDGRYCAVCHNGSISWPVAFETCERCHVRP